MIEVEFTKAFANKKKGEKFSCSSQLASKLIRKEKVAKLVKGKKKEANPKLEE
jgi:hypothetical protein